MINLENVTKETAIVAGATAVLSLAVGLVGGRWWGKRAAHKEVVGAMATAEAAAINAAAKAANAAPTETAA